MDVIQTVTAPTAAPTQTEPADEKRTSLTSDYEMFLQMLTTQMTNQDPLNPVDSSDYAVQLATFSSVEQQVLTNELLVELTESLGSSSLSDMADYVGQNVRTAKPAYFDGTPIDVLPDIATSADTARLTVKNASGDVVQEFDIDPLGGGVRWDGKNAKGDVLAKGVYSFEVTSMEGETILKQAPAATYAKIIEAQTTPGGLELILTGGIVAKPEDITAMRS